MHSKTILRRLAAISMILVMSLSLMTGCGDSGKTEDPATQPPAEETAQSEASAPEKEEEKEKEEVKPIADPFANNPRTEIDLGTLIGVKTASKDGVMIETYKGIPFGKFDKRFDNAYMYQDPLGSFDATTAGPLSFQSKSGNLENEYDCLNLDVWTPAVRGDELLPVYVFFHGGANTSGSSGSSSYDMTNTADDGIVCVSINYRLGAHGFSAFRLDDGTVIANQALSDMVVGLEWVQKYVSAFGGDPEQVTIGGQSAGAFNVSYLVNSPAASGLFDRAILESGGDFGMTMEEAIQLSMDYAAYLSRKEVTTSQQAYEILSNYKGPALATKYTYRLDGTNFKVFNGYPACDGVYLAEEPLNYMNGDEGNRIDVLIGQNENEHAMYTNYIYPQTGSQFNFFVESYCGPRYVEEMRQFFNLSIDSTSSDFQDAIGAFGNVSFLYDSYLLADAMADAGENVYVYRFGYGKENLKRDTNMSKATGQFAAHNSELAFAYKSMKRNLDDNGMELIDEMHKAWTNFIKYGDPNGETGDDLAVAWPKYDSESKNMIFFDRETTVGTLADTVQMPVLQKIFKMMYDYDF